MKIVASKLTRAEATREAEAHVCLDAVVIVTRPDEHLEARLVPDRKDARGYRVGVRRWIEETRQVQGKPFEFRGWSDWAPCRDLDEALGHFSVDATTANDWYALHVVYVTFDDLAATNGERSA